MINFIHTEFLKRNFNALTCMVPLMIYLKGVFAKNGIELRLIWINFAYTRKVFFPSNIFINWNWIKIELRPNFKNFNRVAETPKTGSNWAPTQILKHWIQFQMEPTMFEPHLKFIYKSKKGLFPLFTKRMYSKIKPKFLT